MARPTHDSVEAQKQKYEEFKKAYSTLKKLMADEAYIAAYVIAFSILEDRLIALYVVLLRRDEQREMTKGDRCIGFAKIVNMLVKAGNLEHKFGDELKAKARERNALFHATMWNLNNFTNENVKQLQDLVRRLDRARDKQRKLCGNGSRGSPDK